jgi:hypothetical protein
LGGNAQLARAKKQKLEAKLPALDREIRELELVVAEEQAEAAREALREAARQAGELEAKERAAIARVGEIFAAFVEAHGDLVELAERKDALFLEATRSPLWGSAPKEEQRRLERLCRPLLQPFPARPARLAGWLAEATLGDEAASCRRRFGSQAVTPPPGGWRLLELTRDLRDKVRQPEFSGRVERA